MKLAIKALVLNDKTGKTESLVTMCVENEGKFSTGRVLQISAAHADVEKGEICWSGKTVSLPLDGICHHQRVLEAVAENGRTELTVHLRQHLQRSFVKNSNCKSRKHEQEYCV